MNERIYVYIDESMSGGTDNDLGYIAVAAVFVTESELSRLDIVKRPLSPRERRQKESIGRFSSIVASLKYPPVYRLIDLRRSFTSIQNVRSYIIENLFHRVGFTLARENAKCVVRSEMQLPDSLDLLVYNVEQIEYIRENRHDVGLYLADFVAWSKLRILRQNEIYDSFKSSLDEFQKYIERYPLLGANHEMGKRIISSISSKQATTFQNHTYFRGRQVSSSRVYTSNDMWAPKPGDVKVEGRYNHIGMPILYLASDEDTCVSEVLEPNEEKLLWMQEFKAESIRVLDLSTGPDLEIELKLGDSELLVSALIYEKVLDRPSNRENVLKPEYFIPRFILDVARTRRDIDGICYSSNRGSGFNIALFEWENKVHTVGEPKLKAFQNVQDNILDDNSNLTKVEDYRFIEVIPNYSGN